MATATRETDQHPAIVHALASEHPDSAARRHVVASLAFLLVGTLLATVASLELLAPELFSGRPFWSYGRLYPMFLNAIVFGWLTLAGTGAGYFLLPRLTGVRLRFEWLANANLWLAVLAYGGGTIAIGLGHTEGRPLLEFPRWLDPLVLVTLIVPAVVATATVAHRRERNLYVSLWYLLAASYWMPIAYLVGNLPGPRGAASALQGAFFAQALLGLWLGALATGAVYYVVPRVAGTPLYSRSLAVIGFWSLAFAQAWTGAALLVYGPIPEWLQTVSIVFAVGLLIPSAVVVANLAGTVQGRWDRVSASPALRMVAVGAVGQLLLGLVLALQSVRSASAVVGVTPWQHGTLFLALFGVFTPWLAAFVHHAWPRMLGRTWFSERLAARELRWTVAGVVLVAFGSWTGGLLSGWTWLAGAVSGAYASTGEGFSRTIAQMGLPYLAAALGTLAVAGGQTAFAYHAFRTYTSGRVIPQEVLVPVEVAPGGGEAGG